MTDAMTWIKELYWAHRGASWASAGAGMFVLCQLLLVVWTLRRLQELGHMRERMSRLADGLALLTDTTETGFSTLAREVRQINQRPGPRPVASRNSVARRVAAAVRTGTDVATIATSESLSESEVRLHVKLAEAGLPSGPRQSAARS